MVNLKRHPDYKTIRHDPTNNSLLINTKRVSMPYIIRIKDFTKDDLNDFKETEYDRKYLEENIFKNPDYHLLGHNGTYKDGLPPKNLDFGKYERWVKIVLQ